MTPARRLGWLFAFAFSLAFWVGLWIIFRS